MVSEMFTASPLLALPAELRIRVYEFYFAHDPTVAPPPISRSPLALALVCRQLYNETHALAFPATTFKAHGWNLWELRARFKRLPLAVRPAVKKLELTLPVSEFATSIPRFFDGFRFADAGVALEELFINITSQPQCASSGAHIVSNLVAVLWKTVTKAGNENLKKIRIVHGGAIGVFRSISFVEVYNRMRLLQSLSWGTDKIWEVVCDVEQGRLWLYMKGRDGTQQREVVILVGHTVREAEMYREIKAQLLQGKVLENVRARRPNSEDVADLDTETLAYEIDQLARTFRVDLRDTEAYY